VTLLFVLFATRVQAADFTGLWTLDLRLAAQQQKGVKCGVAIFSLQQTESEIIGNHTYAIPGCGRVNDGGDRSVVGQVSENTAMLTVTSGRNGAVVRGRATLQGDDMYWRVLEILERGKPATDSPVILWEGKLKRQLGK